ncbi:MAG: DNA mismatch repair protein MutS [Acidobacteriota bacterium]|nr:DNA mismatch repair protein MutS [Acidobacteriota bacterium]NLT32234.1 DNA mismatch repair protein MutS [Acidobacteriota bacterium]
MSANKDLTPMMKQYHEVKRRYPDKLVFFRLGDFYEMFYEDAVQASRDLEITLTSRNRDKSGAPIPMCGVPYHSVDGYIARLMKKGHKIAICEQVEDPRNTKKLIQREVTRVLTPGTVVEELLLEPKDHNYLCSFITTPQGVGLAFMDLSTADFLATEFLGEDAWARALDELTRFGPKEILLPEISGEELDRKLRAEWSDQWVASLLDDWAYNRDYAERILLEHFGVASLDGFGAAGRSLALAAAGALIHYLRDSQLGALGKVAELRFFEPSDFMKLDTSTVVNLELVATMDGSRKGSLLSLLDRTRTGMGARLLKSRLLLPLLDVPELERRLDCVAAFSEAGATLGRLTELLGGILDLERLISRVCAGIANPRELVALAQSLRTAAALEPLLAEFRAARLEEIRAEIDPVEDACRLIEQAIADDPPSSAAEPGIIRPGYSAEIDELRSIRHSGKGYIAGLEARERQGTGIASLKVKFNQVFGYFIEVTRPNLHLVPPHYIRKQTLVNSERFVTDELQAYEEKVLGAEERIAVIEKELFAGIRKAVALEGARVQATARLVGELDVYAALALSALENDYVRPTLTDGDEIEIRGGRHPVVELESRPFIPNDLLLNCSTDQLAILTGPNMGGKSTYLRQTALIVIMAQMGSFVPAREARIGCVDRIYTRVGASDNLARGRSTFMVEMIETANILNTSTPRSLILLDEVGRGTATFDGLSLAWAIAEYLIQDSGHRPKTLFATHYHELTKLADVHPGVKNLCMAIEEAGQSIVFLRKVVPGAADRSYGIEVARLAGMPREVLARAHRILERLEKKDIDLTGRPRRRSAEEVIDEMQRSLF